MFRDGNEETWKRGAVVKIGTVKCTTGTGFATGGEILSLSVFHTFSLTLSPFGLYGWAGSVSGIGGPQRGERSRISLSSTRR